MLNKKMSRKTSSNKFRLRLNRVVLFLTVIALGGCVSTSDYEDVSKERDDLLKKQSALEGNTKLLRNKVETTEAQTTRLKSELGELQANLSEVNKSLLEKNKKLDSASQMLSEKNARLSMASEELERRQSELQKTESMLAESNNKLKSSAEFMEKTNKLYDDLVDELSTELEANQIKISEMKDGVTVNLSQDILFPSGSATLNDSGVTAMPVS